MATLDNSNIINGNTVETTDILQLYTALSSTGAPGDITGLAMSGSLEGNAATATLATSATTATTATNANFPRITNTNLSGGPYSVPFAQTSPAVGDAAYTTLFVDDPVAAGGMAYTPSTDLLTVTSSYANESLTTISSSFASTANSVDVYISDNGQPATTPPSKFQPVGGTVTLGTGGIFSLDISSTFTTITPPTQGLGRDIIMTANSTTVPNQAVQLAFSLAPPSIDFTGAAGDIISFSGWIKS